MRTSVADKTPIPDKLWRRHNDPPGLWMAVAIGSVSLHLLAFWLMRSSNAFTPWFPQESQSAVPIEIIEISPTAKSTLAAKTIPPKLPISTQNSVPIQTTPRNEDTEVSQNESNSYISQPDTQLVPKQIDPRPKPIPATEAEPTPTAEPQPIPTLTPQVPVGDLPWNRREEIELGRGKPLPTDIPVVSPEQPTDSAAELKRTSGDDTSSTPTVETANTPQEDIPPTPSGETANTSNDETPSTPTVGGAIATVATLGDNEVRQLIQEGRLKQDASPDVFSVYQGKSTKTLDASYLPHDSVLQRAQFLASLIIDQNGNFQQAVVIEIEPVALQSKKNLFEEAIREIFRNESFLPGHNNDGSKPELSNMYVRITIEPVKSN